MPTAAQVKALIRSHADGDEQRFYSVALQVAAQAARQGHNRFAIDLRDLIDRAKAGVERPKPGQVTRPVPMVQPRGELAGLLNAAYPKTRLSEMALDAVTHGRIKRVLTEQRDRAHIQSHGLVPLRRLLLVGPPGTGKTMTAAALAGELNIPLFSIQLHSLITKYLGETAAKLRLVFDAMQATRAVFLFDEFDALGTDRAAKNEVGEIRRVLNSFLQFLEHDASDSIVVAATNHPALLDRALLRRFDAVIEYSLPTRAVTEQVLRSRLALLQTSRLGWKAVLDAAEGLSHGELSKACEHAAKNAILGRRMEVKTAEVVEALKERRSAQG
ncbi:MAG: AAA family ATPase [Acidobacteria bacterium]|nr:AAA family ATPase [Acidobacteriota bacterium]